MKMMISTLLTLVTLGACAPVKKNDELKPVSAADAIGVEGYKQTLTCYGRLTNSQASTPELLIVAIHHPLKETIAEKGETEILTVNKLMPYVSEGVSSMSQVALYLGNIDSVTTTESAVTLSPLRTYKSGAVTVTYDAGFNRMALVLGIKPSSQTYRIDCQNKQATKVTEEM